MLMDEEQLISHLQDFGLNKVNAEVYVALLRLGPSKASQICNFIRTNRVKGYRTLENLKEFGFVSSTLSNPAIYSANDLESSLQNVISKKKFEVESLEKLKSFLSENYETPQSVVKQTNQPQFTIISGRHNIYMHIAKMIKEATKDLYVVTPSTDLAMMYYTSIPESIEEKQKKGTKIKFITEMERKGDSEIIARLNIDNFRIANLPSKGRIVCGQSECLVSGYTDERLSLNSEDDSALVTNSREFISNMKCLCLQLWNKGKELYSLKEEN